MIVWTILIFIAVLAVIILVHEFGHFFTARLFGVHVEEFGIGFPPKARVLHKDKRGTKYTINWLPFGGFVKLKGEQGDNLTDPDSFASKPAWQRMIILVAGVGMNIALAMLIFAIGYSIGLPKAVDGTLSSHAKVRNAYIQIASVEEGSPAAQAGLASGDKLIAIDGQRLEGKTSIQEITAAHPNQEIHLLIDRNGEERTIGVTPQYLAPEEARATIGIYTMYVGTVSYPFPLSLWIGVQEASSFLWLIITSLWQMIVTLVAHQQAPTDVVGPVGIAVITGKFAQMGFVYVLQFLALISLNLAVVNVLPIPALDGGRLLFLAIEKLRGRPVDQQLEGKIHTIGFVLLLLLIAFITVRDFFNIDKITSLF
jgi:regulator of sigma E protease